MLRLRDRPAGRPLVIGHRGAAGHAPENTMASFELGHRLGADLVECDVHLSADGEPVIIHDPTLERTTDGQGRVGEHTVAELKRLDAGAWRGPEFAGARLPTLDELLGWSKGRLPVVVELKSESIPYPGLAEKAVALLRRHDLVESSFVISFDHGAIRRVKELEPAIGCGILYYARLVDGPAVARLARADALSPHYATVTPEVVAEAHAAGLAVTVWATDEPAVARGMARLGVDAIASDYPDRLREALG